MFGETLVFGAAARARRRRRDSRLALLAESIEGSIATVFRQTAMNRFEDLVAHRAPRGGRAVRRPLRRALGAVAGGAARRRGRGHRGLPVLVVLRPPLHRRRPGYVYAYAYGQLLALSVYERYQEEGPRFVPAYLELLGAGGSKSPEELGAIVGHRPRRPRLLGQGPGPRRAQLDEAEAAAREARPELFCHGAAAAERPSDLDSLLGDEERMIRDTVRRFVDERVLPGRRRVVRGGHVPARSSSRSSASWACSACTSRATAAPAPAPSAYGLACRGARGRRLRPALARLRAGLAGHVPDLEVRHRGAEAGVAAAAWPPARRSAASA